jgi:adenylate cyclase
MVSSLFKNLAKHHHTVIFVFITFLGIFTYSIGVTFLNLVELKTVDLRFQTRDRITPGPEVVLAVIDEKSIAKEGKWVWPRSKFADLVTKLSQAEAKVIAFDVGFLEPDDMRIVQVIEDIQHDIQNFKIDNLKIKNYLEKLRIEKDNDKQLADAIKNSKAKVVLGYFFLMNRGDAGHINEEEIRFHQLNIDNSKYNLEHYLSSKAQQAPLIEPVYPQSNIKQISIVAPYSGYFNMNPDRDGVVRWLPAVLRFKDTLYAPLALVSVSAFFNSPLEIRIDDNGVREVQIGHVTIPTNEQGNILINYRGEEKSFPHIPITDILQGNIPDPSKVFKDKIVMVGATALGIYDLRVTPFGTRFPGLEIHANIVDSIIAEDFLYQPDWAEIYDVMAIFVLGIFLGILLPRVTVVPGLTAGLGVFSSYIIFCQYLFSKYGQVLNMVYPLSVILLVYVSITAYRYFVETRQKRFIKDAFETYLDPMVVSQIIESPEPPRLGGEKREITAFFSDVQEFTKISEALEPEETTMLLNEFLTEMTDIILGHEGTLDKFVGDGIIALFGAPNILTNHAERACLASLRMQERLKELRAKWKAEGRPELKMRIGLCTGVAKVGNMGSEQRFDYTMIGDTVNTASRLEGVNKAYGIYTLISETTYKAAGNNIVVREIDSIKVVGKKEPVTIYQLLGSIQDIDDRTRDTVARYHQGLRAYRNQRWDHAIKLFRTALSVSPDDGPSKTMLLRCNKFKLEPPGKGWNGAYAIRTKN